MTGLPMSKALDSVREYAEGLGNRENGHFTAERYVLALLELLSEGDPSKSKGTELDITKTILLSSIDDWEDARARLSEYVADPDNTSYVASVLMMYRMVDAEDLATETNQTEISTYGLLLEIKKESDGILQELFFPEMAKADRSSLWETDSEKDDGADASDEEETDEAEEEPSDGEAPVGTKPISDMTTDELDSIIADIEKTIAELEALETEDEVVPRLADDVPGLLDGIADDEDDEADDGEGMTAEEFFDNFGGESPDSVKGGVSKLVSETKAIRTMLSEAIFGQDNAINVFASGYFRAGMLSRTDRKRTRPKSIFLFAGPPGVGKTFMAEKIADALKLPFRRFDMSEYSDKEANIEFCGSDKVYKSGKPGNVTSFVEENPTCVLLFDEIEKAHLNVIHLFLQMLDAGRLRDNFTDNEVSFTDAVIILTTNAGKQLYEDRENEDLSTVSRKALMRALQNDINPTTGDPYFPAAICSRLASGSVVMFNHIGAAGLRTIAKREFLRHAENMRRETGIEIKAEENAYTTLLFAEGASVDARTARARAEAFFNDELYELFSLIATEGEGTGIDKLERVTVSVELPTDSEILSLYESDKELKVLVYAHPDAERSVSEALSSGRVIGISDSESGIELLKEEDIDLVLLDMTYGASERMKSSLNIEDADTDVRALFRFVRENRSELPIYLTDGGDRPLSEEEKVSFTRQGVRGFLNLGGESLGEELKTISDSLYQQERMTALARANRLVSYETRQTVSPDGTEADICIFDLRLTVAVDPEDAKNILSAVSRPTVTFDDVIGASDAKEELTYFVEYLKNPKKYAGTGVKAPKGVILYGPPGTGKTMLAKAMAHESDVTFIAAEGNQFIQGVVGAGAEKVHELFKTARKYAPSILFIDEIDAIAKERRGASPLNGGGEETLTAFLTEMDGFSSDPSRPVFVLAATNFDVEPGGPRSLDPALMRRFDRRVCIELPTREDRLRFLRLKLGNNPAFTVSDGEIESIALRSVGMSLAELDSATELALRSAIREGSTVVTDEIFENAFETFNSGEARGHSAAQLERVARHEAGHALVSLMSGDCPSYLTVVSRGSHGGYMQHGDSEGKMLYTRDELLSRIRTALAGRAAELVYYGEDGGLSTGAGGDLATATSLGRQYVCYYGMDKSFGLAVITDAEMSGGAVSAEVRKAVNGILTEQLELAVKIISENRSKLDALSAALIEKTHLSGAEIEEAVKNTEDKG